MLHTRTYTTFYFTVIYPQSSQLRFYYMTLNGINAPEIYGPNKSNKKERMEQKTGYGRKMKAGSFLSANESSLKYISGTYFNLATAIAINLLTYHQKQ